MPPPDKITATAQYVLDSVAAQVRGCLPDPLLQLKVRALLRSGFTCEQVIAILLLVIPTDE